MTVLRLHLRQELTQALSWVFGIALLGFSLAVLFPKDRGSLGAVQDYLNSLPPAMKAMFGGQVSLTTVEGWLQLNLYSWLPLLMALYAAMAMASIISREIDSGTVEFLFSLPVSRTQVVVTRFLSFAFNLSLLHAATMGSAWAGVKYVGLAFPVQASFRVMVVSYMVALATAALVLLITSFIPDYQRALFTAFGVSAGLYFVTIALQAAGSYQHLLPWLIFGRFDVGRLMKEPGIARDVAVLAMYTVGLIGATLGVFRQRDLKL